MKHFPRSLCQLARCAPYNGGAKALFRKESMSFLRSVAKKLQLNKGDYSIRFNPGGIAVSGDATLHHNNFYLTISGSGSYWRTCKGQKDYTGGQNIWVAGFGREISAEQLIGEIATHLQKIQRKIAQIEAELKEIAAENPDLNPEVETIDEALENELSELTGR